MRWIALITGTMVLFAGCGGGAKADTLTAGEWVARTEAACKRATDAIAERGWPRDLRELRSHASDGAEDARAAIDEIDRIPVPASDAEDVREFVAALRDLEVEIDDTIRAMTLMDLQDVQWVAAKLRGELPTLRSVAADAGLRKCLQGNELHRVGDGIRAPVAAEQFARLELWLARHSGMRAIAGAAERVDAISGPSWVEEDIWRYGDLLHALVEQTPSKRATIRAHLLQARRLENRIQRRLRAVPLTRQTPEEQS